MIHFIFISKWRLKAKVTPTPIPTNAIYTFFVAHRSPGLSLPSTRPRCLNLKCSSLRITSGEESHRNRRSTADWASLNSTNDTLSRCPWDNSLTSSHMWLLLFFSTCCLPWSEQELHSQYCCYPPSNSTVIPFFLLRYFCLWRGSLYHERRACLKTTGPVPSL